MLTLQDAPMPTQSAATSQSAATAMLIDRAHLARYTMGNMALELEVLQLFAEQAPVYLEGLKVAATQREWFVAAHTLKGSARAVGAHLLAGLSEDAERLDLATCGAARDAVVREIAEALRQTGDHIRAMAGETRLMAAAR